MASWRPPFLSGISIPIQRIFLSLAEYLANTMPAGAVIAFAGPASAIPPGFLACNGASYSKAAYPDLAAVLGTTWGATTVGNFLVPNMNIGRFPRGNSAPGGVGGTSSHDHGTINAFAAGASAGSNTFIRDHTPPYADFIFIIKT